MSRIPELYIDTSANIRLDEASATVTYVGYADVWVLPSEERWMIKKLTSTATTLKVEYALGTAYFDKIWDSRAGYSYS